MKQESFSCPIEIAFVQILFPLFVNFEFWVTAVFVFDPSIVNICNAFTKN